MYKKRLSIILSLFFISVAFANIQTTSSTFNKDDIITIQGMNLTNNSSNLTISYNKILLLNKYIELINNSFSYDYNTSCITPSGNLTIKYGNYSKEIILLNTKNCSNMLITFLSPVEDFTYNKVSENLIKLNISNKGKTVRFYDVYAYFKDIPIKLNYEDGLYVSNLTIPNSMKLGKNEITICSCYEYNNGEIVGGENKININVAKAQININLISPTLTELMMGEKININFNVKYENNQFLDNPNISILINDKKINFSFINNNIVSEYKTNNNDKGYVILKIIVNDKFGNSNTLTKTINITAENSYLLREYWFIFLGVFAINGFLIELLILEIRKLNRIKYYENKKKN